LAVVHIKRSIAIDLILIMQEGVGVNQLPLKYVLAIISYCRLYYTEESGIFDETLPQNRYDSLLNLSV